LRSDFCHSAANQLSPLQVALLRLQMPAGPGLQVRWLGDDHQVVEEAGVNVK